MKQVVTGQLKLDEGNDAVRFDLRATDIVAASVQATNESGSWTTSSVLEVQVSNNGNDFFSLPTPVEINEPGITDSLNVSVYDWLRVVVKTPHSGNGVARINIVASTAGIIPVSKRRA